MQQPTISVVLNAHREGMIAKPTMESLKNSVFHAKEYGYTTEVLIILDRSDSETREVVSLCSERSFRIIDTDFGDLGQARNLGAQLATGKFIALLDADDIWGIDWLAKATNVARSRPDKVVWHPEVNVYFGAEHHVFRHFDMEHTDFDPCGLLISNYWTSLSFGDRAIYLENPYPHTDLKTGFGFEDWAWNMETIANGVIHKIVPGTAHAIRRKITSLSKDTVAAQAVPRPNNFFKWVLSDRPARMPQGT